MKSIWIVGLLNGALFAGDASQYEVIGFSADGRYVAFERYGVQDGSAFPYCEIFIVDVEHNEYAVSPVYYVNEESEDGGVRTEAKERARPSLDKFGIIERNTGSRAWQSNRDVPVKQAVIDDAGLPVWIVLTEHDVDRECIAGNGKIFDLEIQYDDGAVRTLQRDESLPKSRDCAYTYRIEAIYTYLSSIAVIVEYASDGYEGPNTRQIIVTGKYR